MQSWGLQSRFNRRETGYEPSKSGILGLLCAALGRDRSEPLDDLSGLRMGVRVDREGELRFDFQTAEDVARANGQGREMEISWRYYLADAVFLVGLEGDHEILTRAEAAVRNPTWPLALGRRSYVPSRPVFLPDGLRQESLETALATGPYLGHGEAPDRVRYVIEATAGAVRMDQPLAPFADRSFGSRYVRTFRLPWGEPLS